MTIIITIIEHHHHHHTLLYPCITSSYCVRFMNQIKNMVAENGCALLRTLCSSFHFRLFPAFIRPNKTVYTSKDAPTRKSRRNSNNRQIII